MIAPSVSICSIFWTFGLGNIVGRVYSSVDGRAEQMCPFRRKGRNETRIVAADGIRVLTYEIIR
jgi:hypothetical protein